MHDDADTLRRERDLYLALLELGRREQPDELVRDALALTVQVVGARRGWLSVSGDDGAPRWSTHTGFSAGELESTRARISTGIIAAALADGVTVRSDSATTDPRFQDRHSVVANRIEGVLCVPLRTSSPIGVLYLQERATGGAFDDADQATAERVARYLAPHLERLRLRARDEEDPTRPFRRRLQVADLVGRSQALATVLAQVEAASRFVVPVLLTGPSGTGKTLVARTIHANSPRAAGPFVEINCATLPEALFESELFGAMPGAHSTATRRLPGRIAAAEGGTLFLDEIGELPLAVQGKLLQFLQSRTYFPLGASREELADVRVITATNRDLQSAVDARTFREDLFWRLKVLVIDLPPLDARRADLEPLAHHLLQRAAVHNGLGDLGLSPEAVARLHRATWPGHLRQLAHTLEVAAIRAAMDGSPLVETRHLFPDDLALSEGAARPEDSSGQETFQAATRRFQARLMADTLDACHGNISEMARRLELTRTHVRHLLTQFGLRSPGRDAD